MIDLITQYARHKAPPDATAQEQGPLQRHALHDPLQPSARAFLADIARPRLDRGSAQRAPLSVGPPVLQAKWLPDQHKRLVWDAVLNGLKWYLYSDGRFSFDIVDDLAVPDQLWSTLEPLEGRRLTEDQLDQLGFEEVDDELTSQAKQVREALQVKAVEQGGKGNVAVAKLSLDILIEPVLFQRTSLKSGLSYGTTDTATLSPGVDRGTLNKYRKLGKPFDSLNPDTTGTVEFAGQTWTWDPNSQTLVGNKGQPHQKASTAQKILSGLKSDPDYPFMSNQAHGEYQIYNTVADLLRKYQLQGIKLSGRLLLYTEYQECTGCQGTQRAFESLFPGITVDVFYSYAYPQTVKQREAME